MNTCPPVQPCFCPQADVPIAPVMLQQGGPATVIQIPIYGTQGFSVSIVSNPLLPITQLPLIASAMVFNGNILTITTAVPSPLETLGSYVATLQVCNACGTLTIQVQVDVVANLVPIVTNCALAQLLWTPEARVPGPGDTLLAFTPLGCRALLPPVPVDVCATLQATPTVAPTVNDTVFGSQAGVCSQFTVADLVALAAPACPLEATCDGSCAAPAYSFASQPTSGMWMNGAILTLSANNCADVIEIGASVNITSTGPGGKIQLNTAGTTQNGLTLTFNPQVHAWVGSVLSHLWARDSGNVVVEGGPASISFPAGGGAYLIGGDAFGVAATNGGSAQVWGGPADGAGRIAGDANIRGGFGTSGALDGNVTIGTGLISRFTITRSGEWLLPATPGIAGQVITSSGPGSPPTWQTPAAGSFPVLAPDGSCTAPSYSFASSPDSGMFYTGTAVRIGDDNCTDFIDIGSSISIISSTSSISVAANSTVTVTGPTGVTLTTNGAMSISGATATISANTTLEFRTASSSRLTINNTGVVTVQNGSTLVVDTDNGYRASSQTSGAGASLGTLTNAPSAGDPAFWLRVVINGANRFIPCWA